MFQIYLKANFNALYTMFMCDSNNGVTITIKLILFPIKCKVMKTKIDKTVNKYKQLIMIHI